MSRLLVLTLLVVWCILPSLAYAKPVKKAVPYKVKPIVYKPYKLRAKYTWAKNHSIRAKLKSGGIHIQYKWRF